MGKSKNKSLSRAVTRYKFKHYGIIWVRKEFRDKIRDVAYSAGCTITGFIYELFNRYGEKLARELLAERSKSAQATEAPPEGVEAPEAEAVVRAPKPEAEVPEPGFVIVDMGVLGRFKVREEEWALFTGVVESTREPVSRRVLERLPARLHGLFKQMWKWSIVRYDVKAGKWVVDYSRLRVIRAQRSHRSSSPRKS
jgi:hypothetical protein